MNNQGFQIAIDGPVAAGKGTVAKLVAERLGFLYVDTGAMYRASALLAMNNLGEVSDEEKISALVADAKIEVFHPEGDKKDGRLITILLNGDDVSWKIRTEEVSRNVPLVAVMPKVREVLVGVQQKIASNQNVVMEGRDITYRVLPDAHLKIYLTAEENERAKRRHQQLQMKGEVVSYGQILSDLNKRDEMDMNRSTDPLKIVNGAWVFDTTEYSIEEVVDMIVDKANSMRVE